MSTHEEKLEAIKEGQKGGPGQKNQNAQAGLGAERHQGGGVIPEREREVNKENPGQTGTPGGKGKHKGKQDAPQNQKR